MLDFGRIKPDPEAEKDPTKKEEDFKTRMREAYLLATGQSPTGSLPGEAASSGGGFVPPATIPGGGKKLSEGGKEVGKKLGLDEEEMKDL